MTNGCFLHESLPWVGIDGSCNQGSSGLNYLKGRRMKKFIVKEAEKEAVVIDYFEVAKYINGYFCAKADIFSEGIFMLIEENRQKNFSIGNNEIFGTVVFVGGKAINEKDVEYRGLLDEEIEEIVGHFEKKGSS